jgi:hypothetical protein
MHFNRSAEPAHTDGEIASRHCVARLDESALTNICARSTKQQQRALLHRRQPWRTRRRCHRAWAARSRVDTAPRIRTSRHCPTSALVSPDDNSEYWYIVGNLGAHDGGATVHGRRHRWSTLRPRLNGSTLSNISARLVTQQQLVLVHRRKPWSTRRRHHRAREARSMVGSASRAEADRHCATTARVPPNYNYEQHYIVVNVGAHDGCPATHWWRDRWSARRRHTKSTQPFPTSARVTAKRHCQAVVPRWQCCDER